MNAPLGPSDADLVARVLAADRDAFATVYDRYGPRLYDFAYSMLRHREDAADAVADSFVSFAEKLPQLREPDRLRPWLYAIVRSECLRRLKARKRVSYGDDEQLIAMADDAIGPEASAERAMLQKLVWDAAAGLADRDRALLDLHLRQGLDGSELGEAMGVTAANAYVMLNRLRAQVDRSLGALLIARLGREDCDELDALLGDWDGSFSPLIRKRVARHVESCEICGERRTKILSPWMLLAAVPIFAAPLGLRDRVLNDTRLVASSGPPTTTSRWSTRGKVIGAAAVFVAAATVTTVVAWPESESPIAATPQTSASASASAPTTSPVSNAPAPGPTSAVPPPSSSAPTVAPGAIAVSTTAIDLGTSRTTSTVTVTNTGGAPVTFAIADDRPWLSVSPATGELDGGTSQRITVRADRSKVNEGRSRGSLRITWVGGSASVAVRLTEQNAPAVGVPSAGAAPSCTEQSVPVQVRVTDQSRLTSVSLHWTGPNGAHTATMSKQGGRWVAQMGPFTVGGTVTFHVVATDALGNTSTGPSRTVDATPCPG